MIEEHIFYFSVLWSQIDGNMHMRHSAYADVTAQARMVLLENIGLDAKTLQKLKIGPILMREDLKYMREVGLNERISVISYLTKANGDASKYSFRHEIIRSDQKKAAVVDVEGRWINTELRKLTKLPDVFIEKVLKFKRSEDFEIIP